MSCHRIATLLLLVACVVPAYAQREFGFDNRKPSGQPYLSPEETVARMKVADGFEVKLFTGEPLLANPIAFTIDEKGRVWVVECFEYPKRTPKGKMPRDRIKVLEDTDGDGRCDKVTVFAEGKDFPASFDMASGIEVGHGGVFLGAPPYLWFLKDTDGDGKCDKYEVLLKGFGSQDTHETLNTLQWGPDGRLYGLHGVFTNSDVTPGEPEASATGVKMNAAVWRYDVPAKKFEVFAEGTSNPWGLDFRNTDGQAILCCCVIPHLYHMIPGGTYKRQAGASFNPHSYGLINEICDHTFHRESGWAHAGLVSLDSPHIPAEYRDSVIFGSIHGCMVKRNVLKKNGSTFVASKAPDFLVSGDKNVRPINIKWGPNGDIFLSDWHDQNPCHQALPDSWDYERGRIYRIQTKGLQTKKVDDLGRASFADLLHVMEKPVNPWWSRTALRLLHERKAAPGSFAQVLPTGSLSLPGLWLTHAIHRDQLPRPLIEKELTKNKDANVRSWAVRLAGDAPRFDETLLPTLVNLARTDKAPEVRLQLASTARRITGQVDTLPLLHELMKRKEDTKDPVIPLMIWLAYEPQVAGQRAELDWLKDNAPGNPLVTDEIVHRAVRRLVSTGKPEDLAACVAFLGGVTDSTVRRRGLEGMTAALQNRQVDPPAEWQRVLALLLADRDGEVQRLARKLSVNFRDPAAIRRALGIARDTKRTASERREAVRELAVARPTEAREPLQQILAAEPDAELRCEACRALAGYETADVADAVLKHWKTYPPAVRAEAINLLTSRKDWASRLLDAVGSKQVPRTDLTDSTILRLRAFKDRNLDAKVQTVWGKVRDTPADLAALIEKMRGELHADRASFERGRKVFDEHCAKCHKFEGRGHDVGPELDGAARDLEYLLGNVLDPNRVIGQPYFERYLVLKNGKLERGLLDAEDEQSVTLKTENGVRKTILKKDIEEFTVHEKSVMPEGLGGAMKVQDFRDLVRYVMAHPFITEVDVAGPLSNDEAGRVRPADPLAASGVKWQRPVVGPAGRIPLPDAQGLATAYVVAEVTSSEASRTRLLFGAGHAVQAWLNGRLIHEGKPAAGPDQADVEVELKEGVNRLLFRVNYRGNREALYVRLLDPQRRLKHPEPSAK